MAATDVCQHASFEVLEDAGISVMLVYAYHVTQIKEPKTDADDSVWLARVCLFDLAQASMMSPRLYRQFRHVSWHRRCFVEQRSVRNRVYKVIDRSVVRLGGIFSDIFGVDGRVVPDSLADGLSSDRIQNPLNQHVSRNKELLEDALTWMELVGVRLAAARSRTLCRSKLSRGSCMHNRASLAEDAE